MRLSHLLSGLALGTTVILAAKGARAADTDYPLSFVERPLTLNKFMLAPEGELLVDCNSISGVGFETGASLALGASFGITKDLEVSAVVAPIIFAPTATYGTPSVGATFRFLSGGSVEMGARLGVAFPHNDEISLVNLCIGSGVCLRPSVPILLHIGKVARLDVDPGLQITLGSIGGISDNRVALDVPVRFAFDIIEPLHVGANTGVTVLITDPGAEAARARIPLGIFAGYAIGDKRPIVDIDPFFQWPALFFPGAPEGSVQSGLFEVGVNVRGYIYL